MEPRPSDTEILHTYMLWYQERHSTAPSLRVIADALPMWRSSASVQHQVYKLAREGLVEKRIVGRQGQWWALETCEECGDMLPLVNGVCQACYLLRCSE